MTEFDITSDGSEQTTDTDEFRPPINVHPDSLPDEEVTVEYPDGTTEEIDHTYDILIAENPAVTLEADLDETRVCRIEYSTERFGGEIDHQKLHYTLATAWGEFQAENHYPDADVCVELVYIRSIAHDDVLHIQLRGAIDDGGLLSKFALAINDRIDDLA